MSEEALRPIIDAPVPSAQGFSADKQQAVTRELQLWRLHPEAMALVERESEVYKRDKAENPSDTFIFPVLAAYGVELGKPCDASRLAETLSLIDLLVVIDNSPWPKPADVFKVLTHQFPLYPALASRLRSTGTAASPPIDAVERLEKAVHLAEYLMCSRRLCDAVRCCVKAEQLRLRPPAAVKEIAESELLKNIVERAKQEVSYAPIPHELRPTELPSEITYPPPTMNPNPLILRKLVQEPFVLEGAFNLPPSHLPGLLGSSHEGIVKAHLFYLLGQSIGGHRLDRSILETAASLARSLPASHDKTVEAQVVEAMLVTKKLEAASELISRRIGTGAARLDAITKYLGYPGMSWKW